HSDGGTDRPRARPDDAPGAGRPCRTCSSVSGSRRLPGRCEDLRHRGGGDGPGEPEIQHVEVVTALDALPVPLGDFDAPVVQEQEKRVRLPLGPAILPELLRSLRLEEGEVDGHEMPPEIRGAGRAEALLVRATDAVLGLLPAVAHRPSTARCDAPGAARPCRPPCQAALPDTSPAAAKTSDIEVAPMARVSQRSSTSRSAQLWMRSRAPSVTSAPRWRSSRRSAFACPSARPSSRPSCRSFCAVCDWKKERSTGM